MTLSILAQPPTFKTHSTNELPLEQELFLFGIFRRNEAKCSTLRLVPAIRDPM
jgi:hypothetical protein